MNQTDKAPPYTSLVAATRTQKLSIKSMMPMLGVFLPALLFCALAIDIKNDVGYAFDSSFLLALHAYATPLLDKLALKISAAVTVFSLLVLAVLVLKREWHALLFWLTAVGGSAILNVTVKHIVERHRPALWALAAPENTFSFPSGHAMQAMTLALALVFLLRASRHLRVIVIAAGAFVLLVGFCRMYLGLHYPSDIAASLLLSLAWVTSVTMLFDQRRLLLFTSNKFPAGKQSHA
ncbi:MAG: phosphatase PAP2 family protein [Burkholderiaceae bacterium]|uniref:Phosphatase PAP2 family protein n=1 Tax=Herminiimonas contaminans TaxID=1111140 RepID=A0ABS0EYY3_9BURK|nr:MULTISPECIES: phosphatase PAP2 family protein [Oxalobacteraceae]MBF8178873.1 phosphatase PAP2 family protein [Herminiimonas contaminans]MBX9798351.1 phosphatase PAP2 family protein [Burkholderiaceae bacterium]